MFGLTMEKLIVVAVIATLIIGPHRLPEYAQKLGMLVRCFKDILDEAKTRAFTETGVADLQADLQTLDPRQYDPRRIIREALETPPSPDEGAAVPGGDATQIAERVAVPAPIIERAAGDQPVVPSDDPKPEEPRHETAPKIANDIAQPQSKTTQRVPGHWKVTGSSAHPRRVWIPADPEEQESLTNALL